MKASKNILLAGLIVGILFLFVYLFATSTTNEQLDEHPQPLPTPEILENGLNRYTDAEAGYSFDYPPNSLHIQIGKDKGEKYNHLSAQFSLIDGHDYQGMVLVVHPNPKNLSLEEFLRKKYRNRWAEELPPENLSQTELGEYLNINGQKAIKTTIPYYVEVSTAPFFVYIENGNKIIATGPMYGLMRAPGIAPESVELFMQILVTFRFNP